MTLLDHQRVWGQPHEYQNRWNYTVRDLWEWMKVHKMGMKKSSTVLVHAGGPGRMRNILLWDLDRLLPPDVAICLARQLGAEL